MIKKCYLLEFLKFTIKSPDVWRPLLEIKNEEIHRIKEQT